MKKYIFTLLAATIPMLAAAGPIDSLGRNLTYHEYNYAGAHTKELHVGKSMDFLRSRCSNQPAWRVFATYNKEWMAEKLLLDYFRSSYSGTSKTREQVAPAAAGLARRQGAPARDLGTMLVGSFRQPWAYGIRCSHLNQSVNFTFMRIRQQLRLDEMGTALNNVSPDRRDGRVGIMSGGSLNRMLGAVGLPRAGDTKFGSWYLHTSYPLR